MYRQVSRISRVFGALAITAACTVQQSDPPSPTGPSDPNVPALPAGTPTAEFVVSPPGQVAPNVQLTFDGSVSSPGTGASTITSYAWTFGDGAFSDQRRVTHTFTAPATYQVTLAVRNNQGLTDLETKSIEVKEQPPTAQFLFSPTDPAVGQVVQFNAGQSRAAPGRRIVRYSWNWGDGETGSRTDPTEDHDWATAGIYSILLTVEDDAGQTATAVGRITVGGSGGGGGTGGSASGPTAAFTFTPNPPIHPVTVVFDASGSVPLSGSPITAYVWTFSDGFPQQTGLTLSRSYTSACLSCTVTLTVLDSQGRTNSVTQSVPVQ
jgi:PKD repeat protein